MNNFAPADIVSRIYLVLPEQFSRDDTTNLYAFFYGIANGLQIDTDTIDELFRQTNLASATGAYVDEFIQDHIGLARVGSETDDHYKQRYLNLTFKYNCSKAGIKSIVVDNMGKEPYAMLNARFRGVFTDAKYFYNDKFLKSIYGGGSDKYTAYVYFSRKPNQNIYDDICKTIVAVQAAGVKIYLAYPPSDLVVNFSDGTFERTLLG